MNLLFNYCVVFSFQIVSIVTTILSQAMLARMLSVAEMGSVTFYTTVATFLCAFAILGFDRSIQVNIDNKTISLSNGLKQLGVIITGIFGFGLILGTLINFFGIPLGIPFSTITILCFLVPVINLDIATDLLLFGDSCFREKGIKILGAGVIIFVSLGIFAVFELPLSPNKVLLIRTVAYLVGSIYAIKVLICSSNYFQDKLQWSWKVIKFSLAYFPTRVLNITKTSSVIFLVGIIGTEEGLGLLSLALAVSSIVQLFANTLNFVLQPEISKSRDGSPYLIFILIFYFSIISFVIMLISYMFFPFLVPFVFGAKYEPAVQPSLILLACNFFMTLTTPLSIFFVGTNMPGMASWASFYQTVIAFLLTFFLYPRFEIFGACFAFLAGSLFSFVYLLAKFFQQSDLSGKYLLYSSIITLNEHANAFFRKTNIFFTNDKTFVPSKKRSIAEIENKPGVLAKSDVPENRRKLEKEFQKTFAAHELALDGNFFYVPNVFDFDSENCQFKMEKVKGTLILNLPYDYKNSEELGNKLGKALAILHKRMPILENPPEELKVFNFDDFEFVPLHGDFSPCNILVDKDNLPTILDFNCTDLFGGSADVGPWAFDVCFFINASLFFFMKAPSRFYYPMLTCFLDSYFKFSGRSYSQEFEIFLRRMVSENHESNLRTFVIGKKLLMNYSYKCLDRFILNYKSPNRY